MTYAADAAPPFYHGTRADFRPADLISAGHSPNYGARRKASGRVRAWARRRRPAARGGR